MVDWAKYEFPKNPRVQTISEGFLKMYGISHTLSKSHLPSASTKILDCFDMPVHVDLLWIWRVDCKVKEDIRNKCAELVRPWKTWLLKDQAAGPAPILDRKVYEEVQKILRTRGSAHQKSKDF